METDSGSCAGTEHDGKKSKEEEELIWKKGEGDRDPGGVRESEENEFAFSIGRRADLNINSGVFKKPQWHERSSFIFLSNLSELQNHLNWGLHGD